MQPREKKEMSGWLDKANFSEECADMLIQKTYYTQSVHCTYYRVIQFFSHLLFVKEKGNNEKDYYPVPQNQPFHITILKKIENMVPNPKDKRIIKNTFKDLKEFRIKADYRPELISYNEALKAISKADRIINITENIK